MINEKTRSYCRNCERPTNQNILAEQTESDRGEYSFDRIFQILECLACNTKSFRDVFKDIEQAFQFGNDDWEVPTTITVYPKFIENHRYLDGEYYLPIIVRQIYKESLLAFQEKALILAGLGLRGTVEAVCKDLNITGNNLEQKINELVVAGHISSKDSERLHSIRFMGNDAAHDIKRPESAQLNIALKIVEHMLSSIYILVQEAEGKLDTLIADFAPFKEILNKKLEQFEMGDEMPIAAIMGRDVRRIKNSLPYLETELIKQIDAGTITNIKKGKVDKYKHSKHDLQYFIIQ